MSREEEYLLCFGVGFLLSALSVVSQITHTHVHLPTKISGGHHHGAVAHGGGWIGKMASFLSPSTLAAFLAWFGGTGYLLSRYTSLWTYVALLLATLSGLLGAMLIYLYVARFLLAHERELDAADYQMVGTQGTICSPVRAGGTGEMLYSQGGTRRTCGVRHEEGAPLPKGTEVVVTKFDRGLAYVQPRSEKRGGTALASRER